MYALSISRFPTSYLDASQQDSIEILVQYNSVHIFQDPKQWLTAKTFKVRKTTKSFLEAWESTTHQWCHRVTQGQEDCQADEQASMQADESSVSNELFFVRRNAMAYFSESRSWKNHVFVK